MTTPEARDALAAREAMAQALAVADGVGDAVWTDSPAQMEWAGRAVAALAASGWTVRRDADDDLGAAWAAAEVALPEGDGTWRGGKWAIHAVSLCPGLGEAERYEASAWGNRTGQRLYVYGPTPAAALRALRAALTPDPGAAAARLSEPDRP